MLEINYSPITGALYQSLVIKQTRKQRKEFLKKKPWEKYKKPDKILYL